MNSTTIKTSNEDLKPAYLIISIINFVFVVFGTLGNLFTLLILMRKNLRKVYSYTRYLSALCIIDILCLYNWNFTFIYQDIFSNTHMRIEYYSSLSCRVFSYCAYSSLQLSSWIMCAIGIDRIILIVSTKRKKTVDIKNDAKDIGLCRLIKKINLFKSTVAIVVLLAVIILATNFVVLVNNAEPYSGSQNSSNYTNMRTFTCYAPVDFFKIWDIFHVLMYSLLPFFIIFIENFIIAFLTIKNSRRMKKYDLTPSSNSTSATGPSKFSKFFKSFKERNSTFETTGSSRKRNGASQQSKGSYVKNLLIFLTLSFFFTTLPYSMIYATSLNDILIQSYTGNIIKRCLISLQYTRHSTNFLIYILTSTIIQNEIKKCFKEIEFSLFKRNI
jgi:hypothetical protein